MPTLSIRNVRARIVRFLKVLARGHRHSVKQEVRGQHADRRLVLEQIEAGWARQTRRPTAAEVDAWIGTGRA